MSMHRYRRVVFFSLGVIALVALAAFAVAQPGQRAASASPIRFSVPSGFYDEPFSLELDADGEDIFYTLDSTNPDAHSIRYAGPITIRDASPKENVYSAITDVSPYMNPELLRQNSMQVKRYYQVPDQPVDKATVVRAVSVDRFGNRSKVCEAVYFVGFGEKTGYEGMNIMSIVTDPANLFDHEKGIYVMGDAFDSIVNSDGHVEMDVSKVFSWDANYRQSGRDWERPAEIHCFDPDGNIVFSGEYGIRIQGRANRANLPKNLNIYARKQYGAQTMDTGNLFDTRYSLNRMTLYYGSSDLLLTDYLAEMLTDGMDITDREMAPCVMFLDGEYWGVYWLTPRFKEDYLSQKYDVDPRNIVQIKHARLETGQEEDKALYDDMVEYIADHDMSDPDNYARACELLDIQSCIDYFATEIYIANTDWPINNIALWRTRYKSDTDYSDCRWRWILFDLEQGMHPEWVTVNSWREAANRDPVFASLLKNEGFTAALREKLMALASDTFEPERVRAFVEAYKARMAGPIQKKYQRFTHETMTLQDFYDGCDSIVGFFRQRREYVIEKYGGID